MRAAAAEEMLPSFSSSRELGSHADAPSAMADAVAHPHIEPGHARGSDCLKSKLPKIEADTVVEKRFFTSHIL